MGESQGKDKNSRDLTKKEHGIIETSLRAPFPFDYVEKQLRKKNFGILTTVTPEGRPHSVGVVYASTSKIVGPRGFEPLADRL